MWQWIRQAWERSEQALDILAQLHRDNTLARLAAGEIRVDETHLNKALATTPMRGVREVTLQTQEGSFTISARSERFFLARVSVPLRIEHVTFTRYRRRIYLAPAGPVAVQGTQLWQRAAAHLLTLLFHHVLGEAHALREAGDPSAGLHFDGRGLEVNLNQIPEMRVALNLEYTLAGRRLRPLHFVTVDSITPVPGHFLVRTSVNWTELTEALRRPTV
ncbi:hypothetical protein [Chloracidobacterium aggregatum]|jgi:hypothetical protein|uniref:Outer membrane lipoprotein carrier protein LolA n=1 Tax=Chloracidobacterium sp. N TaxID=2821540 RepID=A0ABX8B2W2_9BACT|nr:hypothetical protein [Chloracidobacterium aggregatum]QUV83808.1 hypothetical protein J8C03_06465 [Chloracidobacterium sp. 2]QUV87714.1 hypothetical protein J8C07_11205 [Chloracidobacterium sp. S]QUV90612.1 hypothetical protein J8C04_10200 [Chloracidobacterium sp. A]QUV93824.1 hypothetical protein J8C05_10745 [Chloracidobacterium sp. N]QUV97015.1 hypothetical protein J8C00_00670 [Chloracidobacterium sp. E]